jgi:uncharacterized protein (TIGR03086 family)
MSPDLIAAAAAPHAALVRAAADAPLDTPTPCEDWTLRALIGHLRYWTPVLAATGRHEVPVLGADQSGLDLLTGDWAGALDADRDALVAAWSAPSAWEGTVSMGGPDPLPAATIGGMVLGELVVHGADLARALDRAVSWPPEVLEAALVAVTGMAAQGREMGVFGPEVPVAPDAPTLDRVLAVTGRAPAGVRA